MVEPHEKPLAAPGLNSYRYAGRFGWVMIGARNEADALAEAARSISGQAEPAISRERLQVWTTRHGVAGYRPV